MYEYDPSMSFDETMNFQRRVDELLRAAQALGLQICAAGEGPWLADTKSRSIARISILASMGHQYLMPADPESVVSCLVDIESVEG